MPEKEGAEEKTTKDVVTKKQKQLMNKEEYVQEMPDDVKNIMMKGLRKGAGEFSRGGDPKNIIKKGVKSTIKNVIKSKSVQNFLNNEYIPEEGYDVARDQGRVKPSKDKKDATTMPRSKEMEKTRKVNKGPSALERVKADIEKRYGKGAIMDVKKEELDLTKVAEAFGGYIVEKKEPPIESGSFDMSNSQKKFTKNEAGKKKLMRNIKTTKGEPVRISDKNFEDLKAMVSGKKSAEDLDSTRKGAKVTTGKGTMKNRFKQPKFSVGKGGQGQLPLGDTDVTGEMVPSKKPRGRRVKGKSGGRQLQIRGLTKQGRPATQRRAGGKTLQQLELDTKQATMDAPKVVKDQGRRKTIRRRFVKGKQYGGGQVPVPRTEVRGVLGPKKNPKTVTKLADIGKGGKQITKQIGKSADVVTKAVPTASKAVSKAAAKSLAKKTITRAGAKFAAKQIPGIGSVISGAEAIGRFASGDVVGGALSAAEMIPGVGLAAGGVNLARDITKTKRVAKVAAKGIKKFTKSKPIKPVTKVIKKLDKKAKKNPLASAAIGGGGVFGATRTGGGGGGAPKIRPTRPKLDQGVVGRRTAG